MPDYDYHRDMDADEAANSRLLEPRRGLAAGAGIFLLVIGAVALLAMPLLLNRSRGVSDTDNVADGQFLPPPSEQLNLTPPPPPPPPQKEVVVAPASASPQVEDPDAARRRAEEEERRRAEAEEAANYAKQQDRYRSPMIVSEVSPAEAGAGQVEKKPEDSTKSPATLQAGNPNDQFLASRSGAAMEIAKAAKNPRIDALVPQGTILRGVLETAVQTDLPGMVRAVTTEDVWSFDGRRILIPAGSRLVGEYNAGVAEGQTRAFIAWTRLLRSDGVSLALGSIGTDELGRSGMGGDVNNHYLKRFGPAVLLSAISAGGQILAAQNVSQDNGPRYTTYTDPVTHAVTQTTSYGNNQVGSNLSGAAVAAATQSFTQMAGEALKAQIAIPPTISINQGAAVAIFVRRDLDFSELYPDPVKEKIKELRRGGHRHEK
jgi:type IV secretion system protein VirB10